VNLENLTDRIIKMVAQIRKWEVPENDEMWQRDIKAAIIQNQSMKTRWLMSVSRNLFRGNWDYPVSRGELLDEGMDPDGLRMKLLHLALEKRSNRSFSHLMELFDIQQVLGQIFELEESSQEFWVSDSKIMDQLCAKAKAEVIYKNYQVAERQKSILVDLRKMGPELLFFAMIKKPLYIGGDKLNQQPKINLTSMNLMMKHWFDSEQAYTAIEIRRKAGSTELLRDCGMRIEDKDCSFEDALARLKEMVEKCVERKTLLGVANTSNDEQTPARSRKAL
jgi:hypothetical protein